MIDEHDEAAIQTDVYLERLLASAARPSVQPADELLEPELADTVTLLRRTLVRFHPSFRFEERLLARLRAEGRDQAAAELIAFPSPPGAETVSTGPASPADVAAALFGGPDRLGRGLLVGGAIASGVSLASIAGVVLVWRRARGGPIAGQAV